MVSTNRVSEGSPDYQRAKWWYLVVSVALTVLGVVVSVALSIPAVFVGLDTAVGFFLSTTLGSAGYGIVAVAFVYATGRGLEYFELDIPRARGVVAAVTIGAFLFRTIVVYASLALGFNPSPPAIVGIDLPTETMLLILIVASTLVIAPSEELLFRGAIQPYLRERLSSTAAIVGAAGLFAVTHLLGLITATGVSALIPIGIAFIVALGFGWLYERTETLIAPIVAHIGYNVFIYASGLILTRLV
jgi:hypothetical protein